MTEKLVLLDVETTGLDPHEGHQLLEISLQIAEPVAPFAAISNVLNVVIQHEPSVKELANDYVKDMHENTGLWDRLEFGSPLATADMTIRLWLEERLSQREGRIAGNSIRLDMNFIDKYLPLTAGYLHYRSLDISALAFFAHENFGVPYYEKKLAHSASEDLQESINELRHIYRQIEQKVT